MSARDCFPYDPVRAVNSVPRGLSPLALFAPRLAFDADRRDARLTLALARPRDAARDRAFQVAGTFLSRLKEEALGEDAGPDPNSHAARFRRRGDDRGGTHASARGDRAAEIRERVASAKKQPPTFEQRVAAIQVRSIHWSPYDRVGVVNAIP